MSSGSKLEYDRLNRSNDWSDTTISYGNCTLPATVTPSSGRDTGFTIHQFGETWSGADSPDYKARIKSGIACTNPYTKSWTHLDYSPSSGGHLRVDLQNACGGLRVTRQRKEAWVYDYCPSVPSSSPGFSSDADRMAAQQFIRRARARISEAQALVSAGEMRESVRMVLNARKSVFNKLRNFQNKARKRAKNLKTEGRREKAVSEAWLEYSFGWAPLVGDSVNLANAAAASIAGSMRTRRVNAWAEQVSVIEEGNGYNWNFGTGTTDARQRIVTTQRCRYFGALRWETGQSGNFKSQFGLTMDNWIPSIWELIPWSFAIDYFTGIGDFLSSITFPTGQFLYYGRSRKSEMIRELYDMKLVSKDEVSATAIRRYWATPGKARVKKGIFERDIPPMIIRPPSLRVPGYKEAYINLGALLSLRTNNRI